MPVESEAAEFLSEFPVCAPVAAHLFVLPMFESEPADTMGSKHCSRIGIRPRVWGLRNFSAIRLMESLGILSCLPLKNVHSLPVPWLPGLLRMVVLFPDLIAGIEPS